jgi:hypothetical protein
VSFKTMMAVTDSVVVDGGEQRDEGFGGVWSEKAGLSEGLSEYKDGRGRGLSVCSDGE